MANDRVRFALYHCSDPSCHALWWPICPSHHCLLTMATPRAIPFDNDTSHGVMMRPATVRCAHDGCTTIVDAATPGVCINNSNAAKPCTATPNLYYLLLAKLEFEYLTKTTASHHASQSHIDTNILYCYTCGVMEFPGTQAGLTQNIDGDIYEYGGKNKMTANQWDFDHVTKTNHLMQVDVLLVDNRINQYRTHQCRRMVYKHHQVYLLRLSCILTLTWPPSYQPSYPRSSVPLPLWHPI